MNTSVGEDFPKEQKRVRELVTRYRDPMLGGAGEFAARMMEASLANADQAAISGDVVAILAAYEELKTWTD
jgi:hypothetical protein